MKFLPLLALLISPFVSALTWTIFNNVLPNSR